MLNKQEIKKFVKLCKKVSNPKNGLGSEIFEALCMLVVFPACEIVVVNEKQEILLTWRDDKWWKCWHIPGGLVRYGESFEERLKKTIKAELGTELKSFNFLFVENYALEKRGHTIGNFFLCKLKGESKVGKFFKSPPKNMILQHKRVWKKLQNAIKTLK